MCCRPSVNNNTGRHQGTLHGPGRSLSECCIHEEAMARTCRCAMGWGPATRWIRLPGEEQCRHSAVSPPSGFQPGAISGSGSSAVSTSGGGNGDGS
eukprot:COSAG01_NODE_5689_length_4100_cov_5.737795_4_plen_96_part_00